MRSVVLSLAATALAFLLSLGVSGSMPKDVEALTTKPNIVFILTDDLRYDDLKYMPDTVSLLKNKGMSFENAFVSNPVCCPSRATIMRGQYAHNTGIWDFDGPDGGWQTYMNKGLEDDNVATRLDAAGYRTGLFGKYQNGYDGSTVPVGWDRWFGGVMSGDEYYNYDVNDGGTLKHFGSEPGDYSTDVISGKTNTFIGNSASQGTPFFAYVAPIAPHGPATPAPRYLNAYDGVQAPRLPSFNERDVSDKPPWIRQLPRLTADGIAAIDNRHKKRVKSMQALDDLVAGVVRTLNNAEVMDETYIFFTTDNGFHHGEHRIPQGKWRPYEEDVRVPLLVRGPDPLAGEVPEVRAGSTTYKLTLNTDFLSTFTDLGGAQTPGYADGRSLRPVLKSNATTWRSAVLLEAHQATGGTPPFNGIRTVNTGTTTKRKYVEYAGGARELYDLNADPYERTNKYSATTPPAGLVTRLQALKDCAGVGCQDAEDGQ